MVGSTLHKLMHGTCYALRLMKVLLLLHISIRCCRESEATANLGAVLTASTLVTMFVVRKLGLTLAELDDVTSGTTSVQEAKGRVTAFGGPSSDSAAVAPNSAAVPPNRAVVPPNGGAPELRKDL